MYIFRKGTIVASIAMLALALAPAIAGTGNSQGGNSQDSQQSWRNEPSQQSQANQQGQWQNNQRQNSNSLSGEVETYREVDVNGTPHFRVRLQTAHGQMESVDLGSSDREGNLINNIEQGDHISVQGRSERINGKTVFLADQVRVGGRTYSIPGNESFANESFRNQREENESHESAWQNQENQQGPQNRGSHALVLLDERFVFLNPDDLNRHLILAKEDLRMGDRQTAAGELRVATDRLALYANSTRSQGKAASDLNESRQQLERLADEIGRGNENIQSERINQAAARAHLAMAAFSDERIRNQQGNRDLVEAGYALQAAAVHARQALMWSDENVPSDASHSIHHALRVADDLIAGNQEQVPDVTQVAQNLSRQIEQIDQRIGEGQAEPASAREPAERYENQSQQQNGNEFNSNRFDNSSRTNNQ